MILKLKKQICSQNIENVPLNPQTSKLQTKSMNFGKSIKLKAQMLQQPHGIKERINGVTQPLRGEQAINPISKMRLKKRASFDEEDLNFKSKMVRFEDEENNEDNKSLQHPRNTKKNSILKKSPSIEKLSVNSATSDLGAIDFFPSKLSVKNQQGLCSNEKYDKTLKMLKYENVKFVDNLFPPGMASLCYSKPKMAQFANIRWIRLEQLFKNKKLVICNESLQRKCLIQKGYLNYFENMSIALNALSNSKRCLQRVIEQQRVFGLCIYYLRINHDGVWKYVIVDDYIPVVKTKEGDVPAFLNVQENIFGQIQIWPFLAQKVLAKIYNCYECLFEDTIQNIIFQFSGTEYQQLDLREDTNQFKFRSSVLHSQSIILASKPTNECHFPKQNYALCQDCQLNSNTYFNLDIRLRIVDATLENNAVVDLGEICRLFQTVKIFRIDESIYSLGCIIKQTKPSVSLRKFTIRQGTCHCSLSLIQKDKKYYRNNGYQYVWARLMVMTRDGSNGYRWIAGKYNNSRIVTVHCALQPGEYYVLITGDWKNRAYQMVLNYQGTQMIQFSRETLQKHPKIISETCVDMAQRFGVFKQINRNLCAYRLIDKVNGFIIQNINNQVCRQVFFHKIYSLPKDSKSYQLLQRQLYYQQDENEIQILIQGNSHFTLIVKVVDGFNNSLANFSFD